MIPVNTPLLNGNEKKYLNECIDTGWISSEGPFITRFEKEMSAYVDRKYGVAVANGTAALEIAVEALGLNPGDEIILPTFTIISCAGAITKSNLIPVVIDCDPITFNMKVEDIESRITSKTKAIMVVHIYGLPCDMDPILNIAKKYNLKVIEDAAEMHGQEYKGKKCGSFGDLSIFSFYPNKHITTGEGGMILMNDEKLYEKCKSLRNLCFIPEKRFVHYELGWNYRMTNLQAALGVAQLEQIEKVILRKRKIGKLYNELLKDLKDVQLPLLNTEFAENIYWVYSIVLGDSYKFKAEYVMAKLGERKIGSRPFFYPMHLQPYFKKLNLFNNESYPNSEKIAERGFYVPSGLGISDSEIKEVCIALKEILSE